MSQKQSPANSCTELSSACSSRTLSSCEESHSSRFLNLLRQKKELEEKLHLRERECHIQSEKIKHLERENQLLGADCAKLRAGVCSSEREKLSLREKMEIQSEKLLGQTLCAHRSELKSDSLGKQAEWLRGKVQIWKQYVESLEQRFQHMYGLMDSYIEGMEMVILEDTVEAIARAIARQNSKIRGDMRSSKQQEGALRLELEWRLQGISEQHEQSVSTVRMQQLGKHSPDLRQTQ